jgi:hypothetical protein
MQLKSKNSCKAEAQAFTNSKYKSMCIENAWGMQKLGH